MMILLWAPWRQKRRYSTYLVQLLIGTSKCSVHCKRGSHEKYSVDCPARAPGVYSPCRHFPWGNLLGMLRGRKGGYDGCGNIPGHSASRTLNGPRNWFSIPSVMTLSLRGHRGLETVPCHCDSRLEGRTVDSKMHATSVVLHTNGAEALCHILACNSVDEEGVAALRALFARCCSIRWLWKPNWHCADGSVLLNPANTLWAALLRLPDKGLLELFAAGWPCPTCQLALCP
jgi:hypothetical protein